MIERPLALILALSAALGIGIEFATIAGRGVPAWQAASILLRYFTVLTNGLTAVLFGLIAARGRDAVSPRRVAGLVAAMVLVGVVFAVLLQDMRPLAGAAVLADRLMHQVNPVLVAGYWLVFTPKGALSWRDPFLWALYPLAYLAYGLLRGAAEGIYAYPFIDVATNGWAQTIATAVVIAAVFVAFGAVLVLIDRALARR